MAIELWFEMIFLPAGCDGIDNLIEVEISKKVWCVKCFLLYVVFSSCKKDTVESHMSVPHL